MSDIDKEQPINTEETQQTTADEQTATAEANAEEATEAATDTADEAAQQENDPLAKAEAEIADLKDRYLRCAAEFDNFKKRTLREKAELIHNGGERAITAILPVLDDMERAIADKSDDPKAIREGVEMIYNKFIKTLGTLGVQKIDTQDQDFDTDVHEAVAMVPGMGDDKKGKVIDCLQAGYKLNDKVIRHAKVAVAQ